MAFYPWSVIDKVLTQNDFILRHFPVMNEVEAFRDFLTNYNKCAELCFNSCINDMTSREISEKEDKCTSNCSDKFLAINARLLTRVQEYNTLHADRMNAK